jgi:hypothetical protein
VKVVEGRGDTINSMFRAPLLNHRHEWRVNNTTVSTVPRIYKTDVLRSRALSFFQVRDYVVKVGSRTLNISCHDLRVVYGVYHKRQATIVPRADAPASISPISIEPSSRRLAALRRRCEREGFAAIVARTCSTSS